MPTSDTSGLSDSGSLRAVLARLGLGPDQPEGRARQQTALPAFGRIHAPPAAGWTEEAAAVVGAIAAADRVGVGEVIRGGTALALKVAGTGRQGARLNPVTGECAMEASLSMAGYALNVATPVSCPDLASEKRFSDVFLRKLGVAGALTIPLHCSGRPFGVLAVYTDRKRPFRPEDVRLAETIAHLLTSSLALIRAEEELHQPRSFASMLLEGVDTLVLTLDTEGTVTGMNRVGREITGFSVDELRSRPFWNAFAVPEESELVQGIFRGSRSDTVPCQFEGYLLAKDGRRKRASWSMKRMSDGKVQSIILSGVDQAENARARTEREHVKGIGGKAAQALRDLCATSDAGSPPSPVAAAGAGAPRGPGGGQDAGPHASQPVVGSAAAEQPVTLPACRCRQKIAPVLHDAMPKPDQLFDVPCHDVSAGAISFFLDRRPDFDALVVGVGKKPALSYFTARVVRVAGVDRGGSRVYLVGCRFTGRTRL